MNIDPIKPYLNLIKWIGGLALAAVLFVGGCNYGQRDAVSDSFNQTTELATCKAANKSYADEALVRDALAKADAERADVHQIAGKAASDSLRREREEWAKEEARLERELAAVKRTGKCAELMQLEVCEATPAPLRPR